MLITGQYYVCVGVGCAQVWVVLRDRLVGYFAVCCGALLMLDAPIAHNVLVFVLCSARLVGHVAMCPTLIAGLVLV